MVVVGAAENPNDEFVVLDRVTVTPGDGLAVTVVVFDVELSGLEPKFEFVWY